MRMIYTVLYTVLASSLMAGEAFADNASEPTIADQSILGRMADWVFGVQGECFAYAVDTVGATGEAYTPRLNYVDEKTGQYNSRDGNLTTPLKAGIASCMELVRLGRSPL